MVLGIDLLENLFDATFGVDDESRAQYAHILASVHRFLCPDAERFAYVVVGVGEQRESERMLVAEVAVRLFAVGTYADDAESHIGKPLATVAKTLRFERATRRVVFRVEIEYRAPAFEVGIGERRAVLRCRFEFRGNVPYR